MWGSARRRGANLSCRVLDRRPLRWVLCATHVAEAGRDRSVSVLPRQAQVHPMRGGLRIRYDPRERPVVQDRDKR